MPTATPRRAPAPARSAVVQPPGTQPAPVTVPPRGTPSLTAPRSPARPLLRARSAAQGGVCHRRVAVAPGPARGPGAGASQLRPLPAAAPSPGPAASDAVPTRPTPTKPERRKKEKTKPHETLQLSEQQARTLLHTQMRGSFQDPSSGEFLGGTGRKSPTFHADRRLQTVCCSCNEILIFPPFFFLSLAPLFFFFFLWCV